jgi:hypothetical protein
VEARDPATFDEHLKRERVFFMNFSSTCRSMWLLLTRSTFHLFFSPSPSSYFPFRNFHFSTNTNWNAVSANPDCSGSWNLKNPNFPVEYQHCSNTRLCCWQIEKHFLFLLIIFGIDKKEALKKRKQPKKYMSPATSASSIEIQVGRHKKILRR